MLSVLQARQQLIDELPRPSLGLLSVPLSEALGRVLADSVAATTDVPPADNSAMDGYALLAADAARPLRITQRIPAGSVGVTLDQGEAARIFTGAPIPAGADAVVMQEDCRVEGDTLYVNVDVSAGTFVRRRGEDSAAGSLVLQAGRRIQAADLGLAASVGVDALPVRNALRVAIFSSGSELLAPGAGQLPPGAIFNANTPLLTAMLQQLGCEVIDLGVVPDERDAVRRVMQEAVSAADCVVSSGGVSVGEADFVREILEELGSVAFWRVAIKPGKPLAVGLVDGRPFFGLPGNPASVFVTGCMLLAPWLRIAQGRPEIDALPMAMPAVADFELAEAGSREEYLRVVVSNEGRELVARLAGPQSSGVLSSVSRANALLRLPPGSMVKPGDYYSVYWLDQLLF